MSKDRLHLDATGLGQPLDLPDFVGCIDHAPECVQECNGCQAVMHRAQSTAFGHFPGMVDAQEEAQDEARAFVWAALKKTGLSIAKLAKAAGVAPSTLSRPLNDPGHKYVLKSATLKKVAEAADMALPGPLAAMEEPPFAVEARVPVVGEVQAGVFSPIPEEGQVIEWLPFELPEYRGAKLFALQVRGRSMDLDYPDGTYVICAPASESGVLEGDDVIVRVYGQGGRAETTIKEVRRGDDGQIMLVPRSSDPSYQPIQFKPNPDDAAQTGVEIIGVVLVGFKKRPRGGGRMIQLG